MKHLKMNTKASAFDAQVSSLTASTVVHLDFPTYLPEAFWECGRTHLAAVRDYARSRRCAPDALLGALLVRAGASQPVAVHVDTGVKSLTPLTLFGGLAGPSGGGKTTANDLARELTLTDDDFGELPLGTGQGIVQAYVRWDAKQECNVQYRDSALFVADEGKTFAQLASQPNSILSEVVRSAFSGAPIGQTNATARSNRSVTNYAFGLLINFVPEAARTVLDQADQGTPQRFLWFNTCDPWAPDKAPNAKPPRFKQPKFDRDPLASNIVTFEPKVAAQIESIVLSGLRGKSTLSELDRHKPLILSRVASILAIWDGRLTVDWSDWALAGMVWRTSCALRAAIVAELLASDEALEEDKAGRRIANQLALKNAQRDTNHYARLLAQKVWNADGRISGRDLRATLGKSVRCFYQPATAKAEEKGWITRDGESGWRRGGVRPPGV